MEFSEFSKANIARCESQDGFNHKVTGWSLSDFITATVGELGEAANIVKKLNRVRDNIPGNNYTEEELWVKLREELADTFVYLDLFFQRLGSSLEDWVVAVFNAKSQQIGYKPRLEQ